MAQISASEGSLIDVSARNQGHWPVRLWLRRHRTRKELRALWENDPERLLGDLGLHSAAVEKECRKWFWQT